MKKFLLCLILVTFVACKKDTDEQKELLTSGSEVSANAIISSQKEIEIQNSFVKSFAQKELSFAQEVQILRSRNAFTEEIAREKESTKATLHGQTQAEGFYKKLGYQTSSDVFMEDGIPHILMTKMLS